MPASVVHTFSGLTRGAGGRTSFRSTGNAPDRSPGTESSSPNDRCRRAHPTNAHPELFGHWRKARIPFHNAKRTLYSEYSVLYTLGFERRKKLHSSTILIFPVPNHGGSRYRAGRGAGPASLLNSSTTSASRGISLMAFSRASGIRGVGSSPVSL